MLSKTYSDDPFGRQECRGRSMQQIDIVIIENHTILREALRFVLNRGRSLRVTGEAASIDRAEELVASLKPQVLLVDVSSQAPVILPTIEILKRCHPETKIIALTDQVQDEYYCLMLRPRVDACMLKKSAVDEMRRIIKMVADGQRPVVQSMAGK